jgi:putative glutamine amidotransferase
MGYVLFTCEAERKLPPYVDAAKAAGLPCEAIHTVTPESPRQDWRRLAREALGLVVCGGPDVEPWRYGEEPIEGVRLSLLPALDAIELGALAGAREAAVPVWGVCRGLQVLNVFLGGTLWQDLPSQRPGSTLHRLDLTPTTLAHPVAVTAPETGLGASLGPGAPRVNSRHHQGVKDLAPDLRPVAVAPDGLVEALVHADGGWWIQAVQWHPENLLDLPEQLALWRRFVQRCFGTEAGSPGNGSARTPGMG